MALCDAANKQSVGFIGNNENVVSWESHKMRTVREIENTYGGRLFPVDACNTAMLNETHWWHS
jgi:hypothetical protein